MRKVKCAVCGQTFDRDKIQATMYSARRYAHFDCFPKGEIVPLPEDTRSQEEKDKEALKEYAKKILGDSYIAQKVNRQIKEFKEQNGYSYSGMLKSLIYFYEVKGNDISKAQGGIGIVPYCYKAAFDYYYSLWEANQKNENKIIEVPVDRVIKIPPPERKIKKRKLFSFLDEEE